MNCRSKNYIISLLKTSTLYLNKNTLFHLFFNSIRFLSEANYYLRTLDCLIVLSCPNIQSKKGKFLKTILIFTQLTILSNIVIFPLHRLVLKSGTQFSTLRYIEADRMDCTCWEAGVNWLLNTVILPLCQSFTLLSAPMKGIQSLQYKEHKHVYI